MSVANRVTYFLEDFILEDGKVGYGGAYLAGKGVVGYAVFVQIPGNLIEVAADPAVLGCEFPDSGKQLVIDRRHMDNWAYGGAPLLYFHKDIFPLHYSIFSHLYIVLLYPQLLLHKLNSLDYFLHHSLLY